MLGNLCSEKEKYSIEILRNYVSSDAFALQISHFENGLNQCGKNITLKSRDCSHIYVVIRNYSFVEIRSRKL